MRVNWTFDEAAQVAEHLKKDLQLDRVLKVDPGNKMALQLRAENERIKVELAERLQPDILVMAKGIADGFPLGAFTARDEIAAAFQPGDHLIVHTPSYQSLAEVARSLGCDVSPWMAREENNWALDLDELREMADAGAGRILPTSKTADGTRQGYDLELTRAIADATNQPMTKMRRMKRPTKKKTRRRLQAGLENAVWHTSTSGTAVSQASSERPRWTNRARASPRA